MNLVFQSIHDGFTPGEIFLDDSVDPVISVIWDKRSSLYFGGDSTNKNDLKKTIQFVKDNILSKIVSREHFHLKIGYNTETWESMLRNILYEYNPKIRDRIIYKHSLKTIPALKMKENNIQIQEITKNMIEKKHYKNNGYVVEEIKSMWGDLENFYQNGFGFCAFENNEILCWCTMEYLSSQSICGIGIETIRNAQNQGIATSVTNAFLHKCFDMKITPHWDCWKSNIPSVKLAEKSGFTLLSRYQVLSISK